MRDAPDSTGRPGAEDPGEAAAPPPPRGDTRRFGDEEIALILKEAAGLQARGEHGSGDVARPAPEGLTLEEIREIAAEAGIDPRFVDRAAALATPRRRAGGGAFGAPWEWEVHGSVAGRVPREDVASLVDAVRSGMKAKGEVEEIFGTLEWHRDDGAGPVAVRISGRGEETHVQATAHRGGEMAVVFGLGVPVTTMLASLLLVETAGLGGAEILATVLGSAGLSWVGARELWRLAARSWERKLEGLVDTVTRTAAAVARRPEAAGDVAPGEAGGPGGAAGDYL